jgi:hypothetical protein
LPKAFGTCSYEYMYPKPESGNENPDKGNPWAFSEKLSKSVTVVYILN